MRAVPVPPAVAPLHPVTKPDASRPLLHRTELAGHDPKTLIEGQVDDDGSKGCTAHLHVGRLTVAVDIDQPHDREAMLETAKLFDRVMIAASRVSTALRDVAASICPDCNGFGWCVVWNQEDVACRGCRTEGRV